jgi:hypothetical protein
MSADVLRLTVCDLRGSKAKQRTPEHPDSCPYFFFVCFLEESNVSGRTFVHASV